MGHIHLKTILNVKIFLSITPPTYNLYYTSFQVSTEDKITLKYSKKKIFYITQLQKFFLLRYISPGQRVYGSSLSRDLKSIFSKLTDKELSTYTEEVRLHCKKSLVISTNQLVISIACQYAFSHHTAVGR